MSCCNNVPMANARSFYPQTVPAGADGSKYAYTGSYTLADQYVSGCGSDGLSCAGNPNSLAARSQFNQIASPAYGCTAGYARGLASRDLLLAPPASFGYGVSPAASGGNCNYGLYPTSPCGAQVPNIDPCQAARNAASQQCGYFDDVVLDEPRGLAFADNQMDANPSFLTSLRKSNASTDLRGDVIANVGPMPLGASDSEFRQILTPALRTYGY